MPFEEEEGGRGIEREEEEIGLEVHSKETKGQIFPPFSGSNCCFVLTQAATLGEDVPGFGTF